MKPPQAWQAALGQLQLEMPKAAFDTWVRDAELISFEDDIFTIGTRNAYARDWLADRLTSTIAKLLTGIMNQTIEVRFVVADLQDEIDIQGDADEQSTEDAPDAETTISIDVIYESLQKLIVKPHTAVRVPGYIRKWLPYWGHSLGWVYVGLRQLAFFSNADTGTSFRATLRNIALWSGLSPETVRKALSSHQARWFLKTAEESDYSFLSYLPFTPGDEAGVTDLLVKLGVQDDPAKALKTALGFRRRDILPFPAPLPEQVHLEMAPNPRPPVDVILDICRPYSAETATEIEQLASQLSAYLMPVQDEIQITHYFIRNHLKRLKSGPGWLVTLLRDEGFISKVEGYQNPLHIPGGDIGLAKALGYSPDRGRKNRISEWLSPTGRGRSQHLAEFVTREGETGYHFRLQEMELLTSEDHENCTMISAAVKAFTALDALDVLRKLDLETPENILSSMDEKTAARNGQVMERMIQEGNQGEQDASRGAKWTGISGSAARNGQESSKRGAKWTKRGAKWTGRGAKWTGRGAKWTILTLLKHLKTTFNHYGLTTPQILALFEAETQANHGTESRGGFHFSFPLGWVLSDLLKESRIGSHKARVHIRENISPNEFVAATLCAVAQARELKSLSGYLTTLLTNPDGMTLEQEFFTLAEMPPADLADLIQRAASHPGQKIGHPAWDAVMFTTENTRLSELVTRLSTETSVVRSK
ncbi:MAG: hypothetical protein ISS57_11475 [Anaerolineales bacterium]|nr:hypothetical protein [Anaerolineales bacterium]